MKNQLKEGQQLLAKTWELAVKAGNRVKTGKDRLTLFPLWKRIVLFNRFEKIRTIIEKREDRRFHVVLMALGMAKELRKQEKRLNAKSNR
jgi:hypothetical protein